MWDNEFMRVVAAVGLLFVLVLALMPGQIGVTAEIVSEQFPQLSQSQCQKIADGTITMGMTGEMVQMARGKPDDINRTVGVWGSHEQWVYESSSFTNWTFLYFENGILTGWQT